MKHVILIAILLCVPVVARAAVWETTCIRSIPSEELDAGTLYHLTIDDDYGIAVVNNGRHLVTLSVTHSLMQSSNEIDVTGHTPNGTSFEIIFSRASPDQVLAFNLSDGRRVADRCHQ